MPDLAIRGVSKQFGRARILDDVTLDVVDGEFLALLGPSGCGKTTLLRIVAGLEEPSGGEVRLGGTSLMGVPPRERNLAMVFQSYALYPALTARRNIAVPLELRRLPFLGRLPLLRRLLPGPSGRRREIEAEVAAMAALLHIEPHLDRRPAQLSGGQRQRVALARAMVRQPLLFLMDEPLSNLDAALRGAMRIEIVRLQRRLGVTCLYVTHDHAEALGMADRVAVLAEGRLQQVAPPAELYEHPANLFVARFLARPRLNEFPLHVAEGGVLRFGAHRLPLIADIAPGATLTLGLRAEDLALGGPEGPAATVEHLEHHGPESLVHLRLEEGGAEIVARLARGESMPPRGARLHVSPDWSRAHLFDAAGQAVATRRIAAEAVA